jgi:ribose transport system ATP-binding protein
MAEVTPLLEMQGISKNFGATRALDGVSFDVRPGEVHALVGENGAGKSTLMKVLSGALNPDGGTIRLDGREYRPSSPIEGRRAGVAMIYQELNLAPHMTVEANVMLGIETASRGFLDLKGMGARVRRVFERLDHPEITPNTLVSSLSTAARQLVEVARALITDASVVVMDEPTSSLSTRDAEHLFAVIANLREGGVSVIYISHFLEEVQRIADRFTVLRDGSTIGTGEVASTSTGEMIEMMVGRKLDRMFPRVEHEIGDPILVLEGVTGDPQPEGVDLTLRRGEILGVAGLVGAGRTETVRAVFGLDCLKKGVVQIFDHRSRSGTPSERIRQGLGLLSEDRKEEGLAQNLSLADNIAVSALGSYTRRGLLSPRRMHRGCLLWLERLGVKARDSAQKVNDLSGGNQQKVALVRLLHQDSAIMLLDEPTRGIDVGSKIVIYEQIGEMARRGKAILCISSYLPELFGICDRIAAMHRGRLVAVRDREEWTEKSLMAHCVGQNV